MADNRKAALWRLIMSASLLTGASALVAAPSVADPPAVETSVSQSPTLLSTAHGLSLDDALLLADSVEDAEVIGLRHEQPGLEGEFYFDDRRTVAEFLQDFESDFGTEPVIVGLIVQATSETEVLALSESVTDMSESLEYYQAPLPTPSAQTEEVVNEAAQFRSESGSDGVTLAADATWHPHYFEIYTSGNTSTASLATYQVWNGGTNTPGGIANDVGYETDLVQYNTSLSGTRPACTSGFRSKFWAGRDAGSPAVSSWAIYNVSGTNLTTSPSLGAYYDWVDASDACATQALSIGIGYANNIDNVASSGSQVILQTVIHTWRGTLSSSRMSANVQMVSNDCNNVGLEPNSTCMGLTSSVAFVVSGVSNNYSFPGCYYTYWDETAQPMSCP